MARTVRPEPVEQDARGIVDPGRLRRRGTLTRYPPGEALEAVLDRFWAVRWSLPAGVTHTQRVLTHPAANLSVGSDAPPLLFGVTRRMSSRSVTGEGWVVAAMTAPGGLGALVSVPAHTLTDRVVPLAPPLVPLDGAALAAQITAAGDEQDRVGLLRAALTAVVEAATARDAGRVAAARQVVAVARVAETDRTVRRVEDLAARAGLTIRTLQRQFAEHVGVPPAFVIRRYRLLEAAEQARHGDRELRAAGGWATLAAELGYSDQAHLVRDFKAHFGTTPAAYAARQSR